MKNINSISILLGCTLFSLSAHIYAKPDWSTKKCKNDDRACYSLPEVLKAPENIDQGRVAFSFSDSGCLASSPFYQNKTDQYIQKNSGISSTTNFFKGYKDVCQFNNQLDYSYILYNEVQSTNNPKYKARVFGLYTVHDVGAFGHIHDWEHAVLWMENDKPIYLSISRHDETRYKKIEKAPHLKDQSNVFAVKYISNLGTHSMGFAGADKNHVVNNAHPTPNNEWFGLKASQLVDIRELNKKYTPSAQNLDPKYSSFDDFFAHQKFETAVPRVNDLQWIQCARPKAIVNSGVDFIGSSKKCSMKNIEE